jgi:hypothetical protein
MPTGASNGNIKLFQTDLITHPCSWNLQPKDAKSEQTLKEITKAISLDHFLSLKH